MQPARIPKNNKTNLFLILPSLFCFVLFFKPLVYSCSNSVLGHLALIYSPVSVQPAKYLIHQLAKYYNPCMYIHSSGNYRMGLLHTARLKSLQKGRLKWTTTSCTYSCWELHFSLTLNKPMFAIRP